MSTEISVVIKDEDRTFRRKFLVYEPIELSGKCVQLQEMVQTTIDEFKGSPDEIVVKATHFWM